MNPCTFYLYDHGKHICSHPSREFTTEHGDEVDRADCAPCTLRIEMPSRDFRDTPVLCCISCGLPLSDNIYDECHECSKRRGRFHGLRGWKTAVSP